MPTDTDRSDDSAEDAALALRVAEGRGADQDGRGAGRDEDAEEALCRRLFPRVRAYGMRHLRDAASAADLAQHVVVVVIEALRARRVEDPHRLAAFVAGVARNTALEWKKVERRREALLEAYGPGACARASGLREIAPASVDIERLTHCLEELAPRERTIVVLTYFDERGAEDIARELAMSPGNVRVARHRALARLHACVTRGEAS